jgi:hypothetical protein
MIYSDCNSVKLTMQFIDDFQMSVSNLGWVCMNGMVPWRIIVLTAPHIKQVHLSASCWVYHGCSCLKEQVSLLLLQGKGEDSKQVHLANKICVCAPVTLAYVVGGQHSNGIFILCRSHKFSILVYSPDSSSGALSLNNPDIMHPCATRKSSSNQEFLGGISMVNFNKSITGIVILSKHYII